MDNLIADFVIRNRKQPNTFYVTERDWIVDDKTCIGN